MNRLSFASLFCTAVFVMTGCTAGSGPTFNAYSVDASNGVRTYRAECHGLLESAATCMEVAQRICGDKAVQPIDRIDRVRAADDNRHDPRVLLFSCGEADSKTSVEPGATEEQTSTIGAFTVQSDALFRFNESAAESMLPGAKVELDRIVDAIRAHDQVSAITIVGHTDRLGPESVNGPLSLARANTVRDYLVARGLDGRIIRAEGVGASQPRTHCADGDARTLIACLQPDRYVSITVHGRK